MWASNLSAVTPDVTSRQSERWNGDLVKFLKHQGTRCSLLDCIVTDFVLGSSEKMLGFLRNVTDLSAGVPVQQKS